MVTDSHDHAVDATIGTVAKRYSAPAPAGAPYVAKGIVPSQAVQMAKAIAAGDARFPR